MGGIAALVMAALIVGVAAVNQSRDGALFAALPFLIGLFALLPWDAGFRLDVSATGLRDSKGRTILFTNLREVRALGPANRARGKHFAIEIIHAGGALVVPGRISAPSDDVYAFLRERVAARVAALPPALSPFANEQRATFGADKVWSCGRRAEPPRQTRSSLRVAWTSVLATGVLWIAATFVSAGFSPTWMGTGAVMIFLGSLLALPDLLGRHSSRAVVPVAGLVISPAAIALQLGDLQGQLTWQEIVGIAYPATTPFLAVSSVANSIAVDVAGARILITDSFTEPLDEIHQRLLRYWRSPL